jgi:hypothetical protein
MEKGDRDLHTLPDPTSTVPCPLREQQHIAMGRCVEYQRDAGCHCEHALGALRRTEKFLIDPRGPQSAYDATAQADQLDGVRALIERAVQIEKARPAHPPGPMSTPMPLEYREARRPPPRPFLRPAPPAAPPPPALTPTCEIAGCTHALRVNNLSGLCQRHRQEVPSRKRAGLVPSIARATGTAGDLIQQVAAAAPGLDKRRCPNPGCGTVFQSEKYDTCWRCRLGLRKHLKTAGPEPAKESSMGWQGASGPKSPLANVSDDEFRKAFQECGSIQKTCAKFAASHATTARRARELGLFGAGVPKPVPAPKAKPPPTKPAKPPKRVNGERRLAPRTLADVAAKHAPHSAPPADIVHLLEDKLAHHREQAAKCERALQALR